MADTSFSPVPQREEEPGYRVSRRNKIWLVLGVVLLVLVVGGVVVWVVLRHMKINSWHGRGTTANFSLVLQSRCSSYRRDPQTVPGPVDCTKIVEAFENAFIFKDPCKITEEDYEPLLKLTKQSIPCGKVLLWSKIKAMAHRFTQQRQDLFTLEDTLLGYLADGLSWCGFPDSNAMNYQSCPTREDCKENPVSVFWDVASKTFAQGACGVVNVLLNGTRSNAFDENSTFGRVELHTLKASALHVWLLHDQEGEPSDTCSGSSIAHLKSVASGKSMTFSCQDIKSLDEMHV